MEIKEAKFTVRTYECQPDGSIRIPSLMQYLQEIASVHAEQLGFGRDWLNEINSYWVLSNFKMQITRLPKWNDRVTIRTWPSGYTRVIATREFVGKDEQGSPFFKAGSEWMVLDKNRTRPKNLFRLDFSLPKTGAKALQEELKRLEPKNHYSKSERVRVPYSSIDLNGHVNNTEYVRWGIDALRRAFELKDTIRCLQVTYFSEVFEGDELDLMVSSSPGGCFDILGRKSEEQANVCLMQVLC